MPQAERRMVTGAVLISPPPPAFSTNRAHLQTAFQARQGCTNNQDGTGSWDPSSQSQEARRKNMSSCCCFQPRSQAPGRQAGRRGVALPRPPGREKCLPAMDGFARKLKPSTLFLGGGPSQVAGEGAASPSPRHTHTVAMTAPKQAQKGGRRRFSMQAFLAGLWQDETTCPEERLGGWVLPPPAQPPSTPRCRRGWARLPGAGGGHCPARHTDEAPPASTKCPRVLATRAHAPAAALPPSPLRARAKKDEATGCAKRRPFPEG